MDIDAAVRQFIDLQRVARLATVDADGRAHVVPICFALDGDTLYSPIDEKPKRGAYGSLRRLQNIAANPRVQVLVDRYDDDWRQLRYAQLRGQAYVIETGVEHGQAIVLLRARYRQYAAMDLESRPLIAVRIEQVVGWQYAPDGGQ